MTGLESFSLSFLQFAVCALIGVVVGFWLARSRRGN